MGAGYFDDITGAVEITQLDRKNSGRYTLNLKYAYPKSISGLSFDHSDNDSLQTFDVQFQYAAVELLKGMGEESDIITAELNQILGLTNQSASSGGGGGGDNYDSSNRTYSNDITGTSQFA
jgi:hypothetical protein